MSQIQKQITRLCSLSHDANRLESALRSTLYEVKELKKPGTDLRNGMDWLAKEMTKTLSKKKGVTKCDIRVSPAASYRLSSTKPECLFEVRLTSKSVSNLNRMTSTINRLVSESLKVKTYTEMDLYDDSTRGNMRAGYEVFLKL